MASEYHGHETSGMFPALPLMRHRGAKKVSLASDRLGRSNRADGSSGCEILRAIPLGKLPKGMHIQSARLPGCDAPE